MPEEPTHRELAEGYLRRARERAEAGDSINSNVWAVTAMVHAVMSLDDRVGMLLQGLNIKQCATEGCTQIATINDPVCLDCQGIET